MHEKMFIIDDTVILGSYNPSSSAENKNDENLVVIEGYGKINEIRSEFERVLNQSVLV